MTDRNELERLLATIDAAETLEESIISASNLATWAIHNGLSLMDEVERLRGHIKTLIHLCQDAGVADDFVAQMFPDAKRKNGQPASEFTKRARRAINEAKAALGETHDN